MIAEKIKEELIYCKHPLFLFHDDPDGLCSFLLLYKYKLEGDFSVVKASPKIDNKYLKKIKQEHDKIFILDVAMVDQSFIDLAKKKIVWVDHHEPLKRNNVIYLNPRLVGKQRPVTYYCYKAIKDNKLLWLAVAGCIADWHIPSFYNTFLKKYPDLVKKTSKPEEVLYETKLGKIIHYLHFCLKGQGKKVRKNIKILTTINTPYEFLNNDKIMKHVKEVESEYRQALKNILEKIKKDEKIIFIDYKEKKYSLTTLLSNNLIYKFPEKIIVVARKKHDKVRLSIRSNTIKINKILKKVLENIKGYGGGHEYACGAVINIDDYEKFQKLFKEALHNYGNLK